MSVFGRFVAGVAAGNVVGGIVWHFSAPAIGLFVGLAVASLVWFGPKAIEWIADALT